MNGIWMSKFVGLMIKLANERQNFFKVKIMRLTFETRVEDKVTDAINDKYSGEGDV